QLATDAQSAAQVPRTPHELVVGTPATSVARDFDSGDRFGGPDENRRGKIDRIRDGVQAPVDAVNPVDVRQPGPAEHRLVTCGAAYSRGGMTRFVIGSVVSLGFHNAPHTPLPVNRR